MVSSSGTLVFMLCLNMISKAANSFSMGFFISFNETVMTLIAKVILFVVKKKIGYKLAV